MKKKTEFITFDLSPWRMSFDGDACHAWEHVQRDYRASSLSLSSYLNKLHYISSSVQANRVSPKFAKNNNYFIIGLKRTSASESADVCIILQFRLCSRASATWWSEFTAGPIIGPICHSLFWLSDPDLWISDGIYNFNCNPINSTM